MFEGGRRHRDATGRADNFWVRTAPWGERHHDTRDEPAARKSMTLSDDTNDDVSRSADAVCEPIDPILRPDDPTVSASRPAAPHQPATRQPEQIADALWATMMRCRDNATRGRTSSDPLLIRLVVIVVVALAAVPVAWALRDDASPTSDVRMAASASSADLEMQVASASSEAAGALVDTTMPTADGGATTASAPATAAQVRLADRASAEPVASPADAVISEPSVAPAASASVATSSPAPVVRAVEVACANEYTLARGDSWSRLAERSGVDMNELLSLNDASVDTVIYAGEDICLPVGVRVVVPTTAAPATTNAPATSSPPAPAADESPTTTAAPTTAAPVRLPTAPSRDTAEAIIREIWPAELVDEAVRIAIRESNLWANAQNWCCVGLFQIYWEVHDAWLDDLGITERAQLFDARTNVRAAYALYQRAEAAYGDGWSPWALG